MDEMKATLPPTLCSALNEYYSGPQPDSAFAARLEAQLRQRQFQAMPLASSPQKNISGFRKNRNSFMNLLRTRPLMAVLAALLAVIVVTGLAYAVGRLAGFIPGVGFVQDVNAVLETAVVVTREVIPTPNADTGEGDATLQNPSPANAISVQERKGITLTIEQVVSEDGRLVIVYQTAGLPPVLFGPERAQAFNDYAETHPDEPPSVQVRLPDGTLLEQASGGHCSGAGDGVTSWLFCRLIYAALPVGVNQFTLEIARLQNALPGELPEDWIIPIQLASISPSQSESSLQEPDLRSQPLHGITLRLLKTSQDAARSAFQLGLEWEQEDQFVHHTAPITLQDRLERYYILSGGPDGGGYSSTNPNFSTLPSVVTSPIHDSSPLTFRLEWVVLSVMGNSSLRFDPGQNPHLGQEWTLDQDMELGGFEMRLTRARLKASGEGSVLLELDVEAPGGVIGVNFFTPDGSGGSETGFDTARGTLVSRLSLPVLPTQPMELIVSEVLYRVAGPWEISWQPEAISAAALTSPTPAPTRLAPPPPALPDNPVLAELHTLQERAYPAELFQAGWVHQITAVEQAPPVGILNYGDDPEQPLLSYQVEAWYWLDENGYVRTTVFLSRTMEGEFLRAEINNGPYRFSLPEGRGGVAQDVYLEKPSYNMNLLATLGSYVAEGGTMSTGSCEGDGKTYRLYEVTQNFDPPQIGWGEAAPVQTNRFAACVNPIGGEVFQFQNRLTYIDGNSVVRYATRFILLEKVDTLPEEAQQLLDQIIMP